MIYVVLKFVQRAAANFVNEDGTVLRTGGKCVLCYPANIVHLRLVFFRATDVSS